MPAPLTLNGARQWRKRGRNRFAPLLKPPKKNQCRRTAAPLGVNDAIQWRKSLQPLPQPSATGRLCRAAQWRHGEVQATPRNDAPAKKAATVIPIEGEIRTYTNRNGTRAYVVC